MTIVHEPQYTFMYTCKSCGLVNRPVTVRARHGTEEDVVKWVQGVCTPALQMDHLNISPFCRSPVVDLKLPISDKPDFVIGEATKQ